MFLPTLFSKMDNKKWYDSSVKEEAIFSMILLVLMVFNLLLRVSQEHKFQ